MHICEHCGAVETATTPPTGEHVFEGEWEVKTPATCVEGGEDRRLCSQCGVAEETTPTEPTGIHIYDETGKCRQCDRRQIVVTSVSMSKQYDGVPLTAEQTQITFGSLNDGHELKAVFTGSLLNVGITDNLFTLQITDGDGGDVSDGYEIELVYGTLEVTKRHITVTTLSAEQEYNGSALVCHEYDCADLAEGDEIRAVFSASLTERGRCDNVASFTVVNAEGEDVTTNYAISLAFGTLTVY